MKTRITAMAFIALGALPVHADREDDAAGDGTHRWLWDAIEALEQNATTFRTELESHEHPPADHVHPPPADHGHPEPAVLGHEHGQVPATITPADWIIGGTALAGLAVLGVYVRRLSRRIPKQPKSGDHAETPTPTNNGERTMKLFDELEPQESLGPSGESVSYVARERDDGKYIIRIRATNHKILLESDNTYDTLDEAEEMLAQIHDETIRGNVRRVHKDDD